MLNHRNLAMRVDFTCEPVWFPLEMNVDNLVGHLEMSCDNTSSLHVDGGGGRGGGGREGGGAGGVAWGWEGRMNYRVH